MRLVEMTVTPKMAEGWLKKNDEDNRTVSVPTVDAYAHAMKSGQWKVTHQAIAFNEAGVLIDGQHRLHAVVKAGVPVRMTVVKGLALGVGDPIDRGYSRRIDYVLGISRHHAGAAMTLCALEAGVTAVKASIERVKQAQKHHPSLASVIKMGDTRGARSAVLGALAYAHPIAPKEVEDFLVQVRDGELLSRSDPAYVFRAWLARGATHRGIELAYATLNAVTYAIEGGTTSKIFKGLSGYRWISGRRRALKIPWTPANDVVEGMQAPAVKKKAATAEE